MLLVGGVACRSRDAVNLIHELTSAFVTVYRAVVGPRGILRYRCALNASLIPNAKGIEL